MMLWFEAIRLWGCREAEQQLLRLGVVILEKLLGMTYQVVISIGTVSAHSVESDLGCTSRIYFDNVTLMLHNMTLTSQKPCQHNNKCDCSKTNGYE